MINLRGSNIISRRRALAAIGAPVVSAVTGAAWWNLKDDEESPATAARNGQHVAPAARDSKPTTPPAPSRTEVRREASTRALKQLDWATAESVKRIDECLKTVAAFFDRAKDGLPLFADEALGWRSEWYLVADHAWPWGSGDRQRTYLHERWEHHVFSQAALEELFKRVAQDFADAMNDVEQEMLIRMRLDVADLPREALPEFADEQRLAMEFRGAIDAAVKHAQTDVGRQIEQLLVAEIAERVLARVVMQLAPRAGLLGAGAAASPYSFGLSLLATLIINYLLEVVWDWWADPQGKLVDEIGKQLDKLRRLIVEGDGSAAGLRGEFQAYARQRARLRAKALASMLSPNN